MTADKPSEVNLLRDRIALLESIIRDALDPGVFGRGYDRGGEDPWLRDSNLLALCQRVGFGAVLHHVAALWRLHGPHPGSEHTTAACGAVRKKWIEDAETALRGEDEP